MRTHLVPGPGGIRYRNRSVPPAGGRLYLGLLGTSPRGRLSKASMDRCNISQAGWTLRDPPEVHYTSRPLRPPFGPLAILRPAVTRTIITFDPPPFEPALGASTVPPPRRRRGVRDGGEPGGKASLPERGDTALSFRFVPISKIVRAENYFAPDADWSKWTNGGVLEDRAGGGRWHGDESIWAREWNSGERGRIGSRRRVQDK